MFAFLILSALLSGCSDEPMECPANELVTVYRDEDRDGFGDDAREEVMCQARLPQVKYASVGGDCDDTRSAVYPHAPEICDGLDNDCNGTIDEGLRVVTYYRDADGDGYGNPLSTIDTCTPPDGYVPNNFDCDDSDRETYPGALEVCDGKDNDCDGLIDDADPKTGEETMTRWYFDADRDGYGNPELFLLRCAQPNNTVPNADDCDDTDDTINPDAVELCDGIDNNCNGHLDDSDATLDPSELLPFCEDADRDGFGNPDRVLMACYAPWFHVADCNDCDDADPHITDDATTFWVLDADGDGFGAPDAELVGPSCDPPADDLVPAGLATDCDDDDPDLHPAAVEVCDGIDNNCNDLIDDADPGRDPSSAPLWHFDADGDGYGDPGVTTRSCEAPPNWVENAEDCWDQNPLVNPEAVEVCNHIDDNCSGLIDEADPELDPDSYLTWYFDFDGDGWGDATVETLACVPPPGYVGNDADCDDNDPDSGAYILWMFDGDGDGYGAGTPEGPSCEPPEPTGWVPASGVEDCDDDNPSAYPGAFEVCGDGIDQSCSGEDEACPLTLPNTCADAGLQEPLTFGYHSFVASMAGYSNDISFAANNTCTGQPTDGAEAIVPVTLQPNEILRARYFNTANASMYLLNTCAGATPAACPLGVDNVGAGYSEHLWFQNGAGTPLDLFLVLDCHGTCGQLELEVDITLPAPRFLPDTCAEAQAWDVSATGGYAARGTNLGQTDAVPDPHVCTNWQALGQDSIIPVEIGPGETLAVSYLQYNSDASIYLLPDCMSGPSCVAGADSTLFGSWESFTWTNTAVTPRLMYLVADCFSASCAQFQLQFSID